MGTASWAIPVGVLAALCGAMFIFIWWWFPRYYKKGVKADMDRVDAERAEREAGSGGVELENGVPVVKKPTTFAYHPPAYTSY